MFFINKKGIYLIYQIKFVIIKSKIKKKKKNLTLIFLMLTLSKQ
jgi:hypothetical protein